MRSKRAHGVREKSVVGRLWALHSGIGAPRANVSGGHCLPLMARRQSKQCSGILSARQVRHVASVGAAASAPHARPPGIRLDRRHHAPSKPQFNTVPHKLHLMTASARRYFFAECARQHIRGALAAQKRSINVVTMLHQRGNSGVTNSCYGLFPTRVGL